VSQYNFKVFAENGVTIKAGEPEYLEIAVTTEASVPSSVTNVKAVAATATEVVLTWTPPTTRSTSLKCLKSDISFVGAKQTRQSSCGPFAEAHVREPEAEDRVRFPSRAKTLSGWGEFSSSRLKEPDKL